MKIKIESHLIGSIRELQVPILNRVGIGGIPGKGFELWLCLHPQGRFWLLVELTCGRTGYLPLQLKQVIWPRLRELHLGEEPLEVEWMDTKNN